MVEGDRVAASELPRLLAEFIASPERTARQSVVSLAHDRNTDYAAYLEVYDGLLAGYRVLWDRAGRERYGRAYAFLSDAEKRDIREAIPLVISEAEPSDVRD